MGNFGQDESGLGGNWDDELALLTRRGVICLPGLTQDELEGAERIHGFRFPPDLRELLSRALPVGDRFPNWRALDSPLLAERLSWPAKGIVFDVEANALWWPSWGPRPTEMREAVNIARVALERAPPLIPIFSHRYIASEPELVGNPVFSIYQTDMIIYAADLRRYLAREFGRLEHGDAIDGPIRRIAFWSDLIDWANGS